MDPPSEATNTAEYCSSPVVDHEWVESASIASAEKPSKKSKKAKDIRKQIDEDISLWSPAKKNAWMAREKNPNAFYYRHVAPGQIKKTGAWDSSEKELFMKAIELHPPNQGKWGIFAMNIPGRVGYQCRNFYHRLLETGELKEVPGTEEKPIIHRKKTQSKKASVEPVVETPMTIESDSNEATESEEPERPEPNQTPAEFLIDSLALYSSSLSKLKKAHDDSESSPINQIEAAVQQIVAEATAAVPEREPTEVNEGPAAEIKVVEEEAPVEEAILPPEWNPRMDAPWRRLASNGAVPSYVCFPYTKPMQMAPIRKEKAYQCSKILRKNSSNPLNLILLSLQLPEEKRADYRRVIKEMLSSDVDQAIFDNLVKAYFKVQDQSMQCNSKDEKLSMTSSFADHVVSQWGK